MSRPFFVFNGINSRDMGIIVTKVPSIARAEKRIDDIKIPGRNGILHQSDNTYENYTKEIECAIVNKKKDIPGLARKIGKWLDGGGELSLSTEPDMVYRVVVRNMIDMNDIIKIFSKFLVQFDCFPFKYSSNPFNDALTLTAPQTVYNNGTIYSEPIITLYGTGDMVLTVNGTDYGLKNVNGFITVDSERMEVYKGDVNCNMDHSQ